ncbi:MAG: hypothetical protein EOS03_13455 [Mesorhizobium sp.]|uniref:helix-turn-helix domain-containing protein n=1 Tax=Mesorhizobium sp. TaxID=1871066 RepID=UPI000FE706DC|nr:helix-turn-helix domain-containing protein [Mesorhizobium sp.]RWN47350.1 MAG: hypothetical protein EOS03_13455 [Mesorhizobium sp.]
MSSKYKRKGKAKFVQIWERMCKTEAWRESSLAEKQLYFELKRKFNGLNNGYIAMSCRQAADLLGIGKSTASRCFATLQERGFIVMAKASAFNMKQHDAAEWALTEVKNDRTGALPTHAYKEWKRPAVEKNTVPQQGRHVPPQVRQGGFEAERRVANG